MSARKPFHRFRASRAELERFFFLSVAVAGKSMETVRAAVDRFLDGRGPGRGPFDFMRALLRRGELVERLRAARVGQYRKLLRFAEDAVRCPPDLRRATAEELQTLHGVGPKTARFFILYTRPGARVAVLDTHLLAWMRERGLKRVPRHTPQNARRYRELEEAFLRLCDAEGVSPHAMDDRVWNERTRSFKRKK
jgi:thermostable 8-oxoguanine DNA glycosylase